MGQGLVTEAAAQFRIVLGQRASWPELLAHTRETEALGLNGLFLIDHFYGPLWAPLAPPDALIEGGLLLVELFGAMEAKGIVRGGERSPARKRMAGQVQQLSVAAATHADRFTSTHHPLATDRDRLPRR